MSFLANIFKPKPKNSIEYYSDKSVYAFHLGNSPSKNSALGFITSEMGMNTQIQLLQFTSKI